MISSESSVGSDKKEKSNVVVIAGGIFGCAIAYYYSAKQAQLSSKLGND